MPYLVMLVVKDIDTAQGIAGGFSSTDVRPVGVFRYPSKEECRCRGFCSGKRHMSAWRRHRDGHMVCAECGYRHRDIRRRIIGALFDYLGANLMRITPPATFQTPNGYGPRRGD